jgi:hypothetical protein
MKWIDFTHLEAVEEPVKEDVLEFVDKYKMRDIMSFKYDWNIEVLAQFHATFFHEDSKETIHWMTESVHYKIDFITFARLFGFSKEDREADIIHFEAHMNHSKIAATYEYDELADGSTTTLKSVYYVCSTTCSGKPSTQKGEVTQPASEGLHQICWPGCCQEPGLSQQIHLV